MTDIDSLVRRIDQELEAEVGRQKAARSEEAQVARERGPRLQRYEAVAQHVIELLKPRFAAFIERFKAVVKAEPHVREHTRAINLAFTSTVAKVTLLFEVYPDVDATHVRLECTQEIIPVLVRYDKQSVLELPLDAVQDDAVVRWFDERIVAFVKAYLALVRQDADLREQLKRASLLRTRWRRFASRSTSPRPRWSATAGPTTSWTRTPAGSSRNSRRRSGKGGRSP